MAHLLVYLGGVTCRLLARPPRRALWDDNSHITAPALRSLRGLWRIWFSLGATQQYYPLLHSAFWLEHRLWGDAVLGYHLVNLAEHALAACLVVCIVRRLALPGAWLAGFVFALHPVCVESVAWISEQKNTLSAVFYLASCFDVFRVRSIPSPILLPGPRSVRPGSTDQVRHGHSPAGASWSLFWWQRGRLDWRRDVRPLLPWIAFGGGAGVFTAWVERTMIGAQGAAFDLSSAQRFLLAGRALWFYAAKVLWPANLMFTYPRWKLDPSSILLYLYPLGALAVLARAVFLARKRHSQSGRSALTAYLLFAVTLLPVLGFLNVYPFLFSYVADHFQYLASLAMIVPFCSVLARGVQRIGRPADIAIPAGSTSHAGRANVASE